LDPVAAHRNTQVTTWNTAPKTSPTGRATPNSSSSMRCGVSIRSTEMIASTIAIAACAERAAMEVVSTVRGGPVGDGAEVTPSLPRLRLGLGPPALGRIEDHLPGPPDLGGDLDALVLGGELEGLLEGQLP